MHDVWLRVGSAGGGPLAGNLQARPVPVCALHNVAAGAAGARYDQLISPLPAGTLEECQIIEHPAITPPAVLQVEGLCFDYPQRTLFEDWSARFPSGLTVLRGGDGSGKTTLLRLLAGDLPARAGQLHLKGVSLRSDAPAYRRQLYWVEPRSDAFDQITVLDYFKTVQRDHPGFDAPLLDDLTAGLSLEPHLEKPLYMLSTGSKRKVWLAAGFASGAALTLLDQPLAALDKRSIGLVLELLEDAAAHPTRAWIVADHEAPAGLPRAQLIELGD